MPTPLDVQRTQCIELPFYRRVLDLIPARMLTNGDGSVREGVNEAGATLSIPADIVQQLK